MDSGGTTAEPDPLRALAELIERAHSVAPARLMSAVIEASRALGATSVELLLADFEQKHLVVMEEHEPPASPRRVSLVGTTAGLAFTRGSPITTATEENGVLISVPLLNGIERLGVLQLTFPADAPDLLAGVSAVHRAGHPFRGDEGPGDRRDPLPTRSASDELGGTNAVAAAATHDCALPRSHYRWTG